ncbi:ROK family protein [Aestuariimicrobium soli]|uniref:ROK family protein n=1 Tax=Aestuariimicrobium soli TaxID=2035834 RepID=UPI003EBFB654
MSEERRRGLSGPVMRAANERLVLRALQESSLSRTELAQRLGLSQMAVSRLVVGLVDRGLVEESDDAPATRGPGRPRRMLALGSSWVGVGVDCRVDRTEVVGVGRGGNVVHRRLSAALKRPTPDEAVTQIVDAVHEVQAATGGQIAGVGVAMPAKVRLGRIVVGSHHVDWHDVPVADLLEQRLELPAVVHNIASSAALANARQPETAGTSRLMHLQIGVGLGMALTRGLHVDDTLDADRGSPGHVPLGDPSRPCHCGRGGCIDAMIGFAVVERAATEQGLGAPAGPDHMNTIAAAVGRAAGAGEPWAVSLLERLADDLAGIVAVFTTLEAPEVLTLGGYPLALGDDFLAEVRVRVEALSREPMRLVRTSLGDRATAVGAALSGLGLLGNGPGVQAPRW